MAFVPNVHVSQWFFSLVVVFSCSLSYSLVPLAALFYQKVQLSLPPTTPGGFEMYELLSNSRILFYQSIIDDVDRRRAVFSHSNLSRWYFSARFDNFQPRVCSNKKFAELEFRARERKKISRREIYEILGGFLSEFSTYSDWIYWMFSE